MKFGVYQAELKKAIASVFPAVASGRNILPILSGVRFTAVDDKTVVAQASNLEVSITYAMSVFGLNPECPDIVVPAKLLSDLVNQLPDDAITWDSTETTATIQCRSFSNTIQCFSAIEYPTHPNVSYIEHTDLIDDTVLEGISTVLHAAAFDNSRPVLTAVLIQKTPQSFSAVCADGFRLARFELPLTSPSEYEAQIPATTMNAVVRLLRGSGSVRLTVTDRMVLFSTEYITILSRVIDGKYPDVARVIPTEWKSNAVVSGKEFIQALKLSALFANEANTLDFVISDPVTVQSIHAKNGNGKNNISSIFAGEPVTIALNAKYTQDAIAALGNVGGDEVMLSVINASSPIRITKRNGKTLCLVMPIARR